MTHERYQIIEWPDADPPLSRAEQQILEAAVQAICIVRRCKPTGVDGIILMRTILSVAAQLALIYEGMPIDGLKVVQEKIIGAAVSSVIDGISEEEGSKNRWEH